MRHRIPVCELEFDEGGNTIWIQSPQGATVLRIKTMREINTKKCLDSPVSHCDIIINDDITFCIAEDAKAEVTHIKETIALLSSMVEGGEMHTETSRNLVANSLRVLNE